MRRQLIGRGFLVVLGRVGWEGWVVLVSRFLLFHCSCSLREKRQEITGLLCWSTGCGISKLAALRLWKLKGRSLSRAVGVSSNQGDRVVFVDMRVRWFLMGGRDVRRAHTRPAPNDRDRRRWSSFAPRKKRFFFSQPQSDKNATFAERKATVVACKRPILAQIAAE